MSQNVYDGKMDPECIAICDAINRIPGLQTNESCCGHGETSFRIFFRVTDPKELPVLLYYLDPCHVRFMWSCRVRTDCAMSPVSYYIESLVEGEEAYRQANVIAKEINEYLEDNSDSTRAAKHSSTARHLL